MVVDSIRGWASVVAAKYVSAFMPTIVLHIIHVRLQTTAI